MPSCTHSRSRAAAAPGHRLSNSSAQQVRPDSLLLPATQHTCMFIRTSQRMLHILCSCARKLLSLIILSALGHTESAQDCRTRGSEPTVAHHAWVSCKGCLKAKRALTVWVRCRRDTPLHRPGNIQEAPSTVWRSVSIRRVT